MFDFDMSLDECDLNDVKSNWKKIERDLIKVGLKDGLSDGRDSNFQHTFDKGYADGFHNGFQLGKLNFQRIESNKLTSAEAAEILENANKAVCVVCTTEKGNEDVADIRKKQSHSLVSALDTVAQALNYE